MPARITLEAFNPFIPGDEDNSSLPAAFFDWSLTNTADETTDFTVAFSCGNPFRISDGGFSAYEKKDGLSSITLKSRNYIPEKPEYGDVKLAYFLSSSKSHAPQK